MASKKKGATRRAKTATKRRKIYVNLKKTEKKQIREFAKFIPALDKLRGKTKITPAEYGQFTKAKKKLRHTENLKPLTAKQAKQLKGVVVGGGVRAIRLRNTAEHAKVRVRKGGVVVTSNGRTWEYHPTTNIKDHTEMVKALIEKARELFNRDKAPPYSLHLWTSKGRAAEGFSNFEMWANYIFASFNKYQNADEFVWGVAAMVTDHGKTRKPLAKSKKISEAEAAELENDYEEDEEE